MEEDDDAQHVTGLAVTLFNRLLHILRDKEVIGQADIDKLFEVRPGTKGQVAEMLAILKEMHEQDTKKSNP
jgi:hypothetical protein